MPRLIRRYENRKLYDTEQKCYVSLGDLAALIREGHELQVIESISGEDVTARTLTTIIVEAERDGQEPLSTGFLHEVIRWGGKVVTVTVDQVEQQFERLARASLQRLKPVREAREQMQELRVRIEALEAAVDDLEEKQGRLRPDEEDQS